jgi:hypothetical protein
MVIEDAEAWAMLAPELFTAARTRSEGSFPALLDGFRSVQVCHCDFACGHPNALTLRPCRRFTGRGFQRLIVAGSLPQNIEN